MNYAPVFGILVQEQHALCAAHDSPQERWLTDAKAFPPIPQEQSLWVLTEAPCAECGA